MQMVQECSASLRIHLKMWTPSGRPMAGALYFPPIGMEIMRFTFKTLTPVKLKGSPKAQRKIAGRIGHQKRISFCINPHNMEPPRYTPLKLPQERSPELSQEYRLSKTAARNSRRMVQALCMPQAFQRNKMASSYMIWPQKRVSMWS